MQAIVRLVLTQKARDAAAGLATAGYVTGYRGSPIATIENAFRLAGKRVAEADILFQPQINEDLAATAIWGSQQAELRGEGRFDGVFGVWYGKGPGVDRSGDALRHANHAGTSRHGGVLALMGDDHTCESSTSAHQSEFAFVDAMIPILSPSSIQDVLDLGVIGFALSRYAGVWVGLKCVKDTIESATVVDAALDRITIRLPDESEFAMPTDGLNIRLGDTPLAKEARLHNHKRAAVLAFARANRLDRIVMTGGAQPRVGVIASGKAYADVRSALTLLGIDPPRADALGLRVMKVAMPWPLEPQGLRRFAEGLDLILVVEEKRSLIETQVKEQLYDHPDRPRVLGKRDEDGAWLLPAAGALDPHMIALAIGRRLAARNADDEELAARLASLDQSEARLRRLTASGPGPQRKAYFCAGCPHNTSTRVPDGARAYAGIGCHYMVQWMDRSTEGFTQMGGEGANWIGEAPFSKRRHVYQNIGDGTYVHSGSLAIRAAVASGVTMTYKLLYNDAVAMTGGQHLEGNITLPQMARQIVGEGARRVAVVAEDPNRFGPTDLPAGVTLHPRTDLDAVQRELADSDGVSVLIYDQTCAAEKRRRRKRAVLPEPAERVFINHLVCEGCGDCGLASNCVAIEPRSTEAGLKREINQSQCNKDFSCLDGLCPSFVTIEGARVRRRELPAIDDALHHLPEPSRPSLVEPMSLVTAGIGGTGIVTVTAVLGQAAYLAGLGFGAIDMTGIAQKGGPVVCHMRFARRAEDIGAIRIGTEDADVLIGADLVVTAQHSVLGMVAPGRTALVLSTHAATSGSFTRSGTVEDAGVHEEAIRQRAGKAPWFALDAQAAALTLLGDTIYANMLLTGSAYQAGHIPVASSAIEDAIALNGVDVETNRRAFRLGRLAVAAPDAFAKLMEGATDRPSNSLATADPIERLARDLESYQDRALADRFRARVGRIASLGIELGDKDGLLADSVARAYHKVLAIKDEYEVARLFTDGRFEADVRERFQSVGRITYHMAPPLLARLDPTTGRPSKRRFGPWLRPGLLLLAKARRLRGGPFDVFGWTAERRAERAFARDYERMLDLIEQRGSPRNLEALIALAQVPITVRGYGIVKTHALEAARTRAQMLEQSLIDASGAAKTAVTPDGGAPNVSGEAAE